MTPLDRAHRAMQAVPEDAAARLRFYEALVEGELVVLLAEEPKAGAEPRPAQFATAEGTLVLAFEDEARLAGFTGAPAPYAALPGRALVQRLAGSGLGLGLNLGAPSEYLLPPAALDWLAGMFAPARSVEGPPPQTLDAPRLPEALLEALRRKLGQAAGLASHVLLASADWPDGRRGHLLAFVGAAPGAEAALAQSVAEALAFSGQAFSGSGDSDAQAAAGLDVLFLAPEAPLRGQMASVALRLDLPKAPATSPAASPAAVPASPPPPRLR